MKNTAFALALLGAASLIFGWVWLNNEFWFWLYPGEGSIVGSLSTGAVGPFLCAAIYADLRGWNQ